MIGQENNVQFFNELENGYFDAFDVWNETCSCVVRTTRHTNT